MINRILIRMKVVQMLYSYMLTRSDFKILSEPERLTRDTRFGYEIYQSLLLLLLEITGYNTDLPLPRLPCGAGLSEVARGVLFFSVGGEDGCEVVHPEAEVAGECCLGGEAEADDEEIALAHRSKSCAWGL